MDLAGDTSRALFSELKEALKLWVDPHQVTSSEGRKVVVNFQSVIACCESCLPAQNMEGGIHAPVLITLSLGS